jgi:SH3-like domain-containing protein
MKNNCWLILGMMLSTSLLAQQATNPAPAAPIEMPAAAPVAKIAPATTGTKAPAAKAGKKKAANKKAQKAPQKKAAKKAAAKKKEALPELRTVPLVAGPAVVVASNVNVRGQAKLKSEVVTRITKGQSVSVLEEIVRNNSGPDEPSAWAKISLPPGAHVWINTAFLNAANQTVRPKKLNLRSGPGENYSVIGLVHGGDAVKPMTTKGDWTEIEAPAGAYAFVAAQYLKQGLPEAPVPIVAAAPTPAPAPAPTPAPAPIPVPPEPAPTPTAVAAAPTMAPPPTESPVVPAPTEPPAVTSAPTPPPTPAPAPIVTPTETPAEPAVAEPLPPRIVQREGIVRGMTSIQAPSKFVLISPENGRDIDYLYTTSKELDLRRYKGLRIIVTGEEALDERWGNTPVITIQKILVVE